MNTPPNERPRLIDRCLCAPHRLLLFTVGKHHKTHHRMLGGVVLMVIGVAVAKSAEFFHFPGSHFTLDLIGYAVHGLGATPFIERAIE